MITHTRLMNNRTCLYHLLFFFTCFVPLKLAISCNQFILIFRIDKFSPTSNFIHYFFDMQIFFQFRRSTHNVLSNSLKFYPKCSKNSSIIFPKFLKNFHEAFEPNFAKFLTTSKICPYFSLNSAKIFLNISFSKFSPNLLQ